MPRGGRSSCRTLLFSTDGEARCCELRPVADCGCCRLFVRPGRRLTLPFYRPRIAWSRSDDGGDSEGISGRFFGL